MFGRNKDQNTDLHKKIFTIRDSKAGIYGPPFMQLSHAEAERSFTKLANDLNTQIAQTPEDFDLYYLGTYDDRAGKLFVEDTPLHMLKANSVSKLNLGALNQTLTQVHNNEPKQFNQVQ